MLDILKKPHTIVAIAAAIAMFLASGIALEFSPGAAKWFHLIGGLLLVVSATLAGLTGPTAPAPSADAKPAPKVPPIVTALLSAMLFGLAFFGCSALTGCAR